MKYAFSISAALLLALGQLAPAQAQSPRELVNQAIAAEGGLDALRGLKALAIKADAMHWEPGQSKAAGGEPRMLGNTALTITWDLANGMARTEWDRDMKYPAVEKIKYTDVVTPALGYVIDDKGASKPMSGIRVAATLRELERASPTLMLKALDANSGLRAAGNQKLGSKTLRAVSFNDGGTNFTVLIDPQSKLPAAIRTRDDDNISGDSTYDLIPGDWKAVGGVKIAHTHQLNGVEVGKVTYKEVTANPTIASNAFAVPEAVKSAAKAPATGNVPYQWVIRRIALGRFLDSERHHCSARREPQAGRACAQRAARAGRIGQQPDRRDEGPSRRVRCALRRAAIALGHRRGEEEISGQADPVPGAHPSPYGSHRRYPHLHGGRGNRDRADTGQGLFREGRAHAAHRGAR
jgi:hypothetical protein